MHFTSIKKSPTVLELTGLLSNAKVTIAKISHKMERLQDTEEFESYEIDFDYYFEHFSKMA